MRPAKATVDNWKEIFSKRPKDALPPVYEDLEFLYDYVTEKRCKTILEFGSGCSTLVMAEDSQKTTLVGLTVFSFDDDRKWLWETQKMILKDMEYAVSLHYALVNIAYLACSRTIPCFHYCNGDNSIIPDLIYLDGPELTKDVRVTIDPLFYEHKMCPGTAIIVDGREENVEFLKAHLLRKWKFRHENIGDNGMSIFELEG